MIAKLAKGKPMAGVAVETDDRTGQALMVAPLRVGGRLSPALVAAWES